MGGTRIVDECNARRVVMLCCQSVLTGLLNVRLKATCRGEGRRYKSDEEQPVWALVDQEKWCRAMKVLSGQIFNEDDNDRDTIDALISRLPNETEVARIWKCLRDLALLCCKWLEQHRPDIMLLWLPTCTESSRVKIEPRCFNRLGILWTDPSMSSLADYLSLVEDMLGQMRMENRQPTCAEYFAAHLAHLDISEGSQERRKVCPLGSPGFHRDTQTYLSLTNPGQGHVMGTTRRSDWLRGVLVHVEYIERPKRMTGTIEPYRIPSALDLSLVRLHVGISAPTTYYVGRIYTDPTNFENDFKKVVYLTANAASWAFTLGAAECKVSVSMLTTSQALRFMRSLGAEVMKAKHQALSAAWSINQPLWHDLPSNTLQEGTMKKLTKPVDIARIAVDVTSRGDFQKVTWDGASHACRSRCVLEHLSSQEALTIVHEAHERGLLTYFSAGFKKENIGWAVRSGVDGVGIGGVLHYMDPDTGMMGPYKDEDIPHILAKRDEAASDSSGKAALLLARLDTMYWEGSITSVDNDLRQTLFDAMLSENEELVKSLMDKLRHVLELESEDTRPYLHRARRLLTSHSPMLRQTCSQKQWNELKSVLTPLVEKEDETAIMEEFHSKPWVSIRQNRRLQHGGDVSPSSEMLPIRICPSKL